MDRLFLETKVLADDAGAVSGIAWKWGQPDRIGDEIEPDAFGTIKMPLPMLFSHDLADPIGIWDVATSKADGLHISGKLLVDEVQRAREVRALVKAGAVKGLSIGFGTQKAKPRNGGGRIIQKAELHEISLVTIGMHPGAKVTSAKSIVHALSVAEAINAFTRSLR